MTLSAETKVEKIRRLLALGTPNAESELSDETIERFLDDYNQDEYVAAVWVARHYISLMGPYQPEKVAALRLVIDDLLRKAGEENLSNSIVILGSPTASVVETSVGGLSSTEVDAKIALHTADDDAHHAAGLSSAQVDAKIATHTAVNDAHHGPGLSSADVDTKIATHTADSDAHHAPGRVTSLTYTPSNRRLTLNNSDGSQHATVLPAPGLSSTAVDTKIALHTADDDAHHSPGLSSAEVDTKIATHTADSDAHHTPGQTLSQVNALIATHTADSDAHHTPTVNTDTDTTLSSAALGSNNVLTLTLSDGSTVTVDLSSLAGTGGGGGGTGGYVAPTTRSETRFTVFADTQSNSGGSHDETSPTRHTLTAALYGNSDDMGITSGTLRAAVAGMYSLTICVEISASGGNRKTFRPVLEKAEAGSPNTWVEYWCGTAEYVRDSNWIGNSMMWTVPDIVMTIGDKLRFVVLAREDAGTNSTISYTTASGSEGRIWRRTA